MDLEWNLVEPPTIRPLTRMMDVFTGIGIFRC